MSDPSGASSPLCFCQHVFLLGCMQLVWSPVCGSLSGCTPFALSQHPCVSVHGDCGHTQCGGHLFASPRRWASPFFFSLFGMKTGFAPSSLAGRGRGRGRGRVSQSRNVVDPPPPRRFVLRLFQCTLLGSVSLLIFACVLVCVWFTTDGRARALHFQASQCLACVNVYL